MLVPHVLFVEDDPKTRFSVADGLQREGWDVTTASTGTEAMMLVQERTFDLLLLDWMLPDGDGIAVMRCAHGNGSRAPVLMLTARDTVQDCVKGLDEGADDYLVKPFAFPELLARGRALLRRPAAAVAAVEMLCCADLELDLRARVARRGGIQISLSPREVDILDYLLRHKGQIVTREMLQRDIWKEPHRFSSLDNVIDVQIMRLRRKVDCDVTENLIHTIRGLGYRLGAPDS